MTRIDMDAVLDESIKTAVHFLEKFGEFFPFAVAKARNGEIRHVQTRGEDERPSSNEVIEVLHRALKTAAQEGEYRTTALVSDFRLRDRNSGKVTDAIRVELEDAEAQPVICYLPYVRVDNALKLGEIKAEKGKSIVFASPEPE
jgi:hypothetical protein